MPPVTALFATNGGIFKLLHLPPSFTMPTNYYSPQHNLVPLTCPGCFAAESMALLVCLSHLRSTAAGGSCPRLAMLMLPMPR